MQDVAYLFVDGGYFNCVVNNMFVPVFGGGYGIDYDLLKKSFNARKAFYYDCLDEIPRKGESEDDLKARVQGQRDQFDEIRSVEGMHVREGWLSKGKRKQQKEVDVQLAVDMMNHAFRRNMTRAVLVAGDRDFKPLVESLVEFGTYVHLVCDPRTTAKELSKASDLVTRIDVAMLCDWMRISEDDDQKSHFPHGSRISAPIVRPREVIPTSEKFRDGTVHYKGQDRPAMVFGNGERNRVGIIIELKPGLHQVYIHHDRGQLEGYVALLFDEIKWD